jgi:flagellar biosynthetic protein FliO
VKTKLRRLNRAVFCLLILDGTTAFASASDPLPDTGLSVLRVMGALALVLALFFGGVWMVKNRRRIPGFRRRAPHLNVLEVRSLGNRHSLCLIACEQQRLLLAVSPNGVTLLSRLPEGTREDQPLTAGASSPTFGAILQGFLAQKT